MEINPNLINHSCINNETCQNYRILETSQSNTSSLSTLESKNPGCCLSFCRCILTPFQWIGYGIIWFIKKVFCIFEEKPKKNEMGIKECLNIVDQLIALSKSNLDDVEMQKAVRDLYDQLPDSATIELGGIAVDLYTGDQEGLEDFQEIEQLVNSPKKAKELKKELEKMEDLRALEEYKAQLEYRILYKMAVKNSKNSSADNS